MYSQVDPLTLPQYELLLEVGMSYNSGAIVRALFSEEEYQTKVKKMLGYNYAPLVFILVGMGLFFLCMVAVAVTAVLTSGSVIIVVPIVLLVLVFISITVGTIILTCRSANKGKSKQQYIRDLNARFVSHGFAFYYARVRTGHKNNSFSDITVAYNLVLMSPQLRAEITVDNDVEYSECCTPVGYQTMFVLAGPTAAQLASAPAQRSLPPGAVPVAAVTPISRYHFLGNFPGTGPSYTPGTAVPGAGYPPGPAAGPGYTPAGPAYPSGGPTYPSGGAAYTPGGPTYPSGGPTYPSGGPAYTPGGPTYTPGVGYV